MLDSLSYFYQEICYYQIFSQQNSKINKDQKNLMYNVRERDGKDLKYLLNSSKVRKKYPGLKYTSLDDGIKETINWVKQNLKYLRKQSLNYKHKK